MQNSGSHKTRLNKTS